MQEIILDTPIEISPMIEAKTTSSVFVASISENYGWTYNSAQPGRNYPGIGRPQSVEAVVILDLESNKSQNIIVWEGEDYLAVRGTWTDQDLYDKIKIILNPPIPTIQVSESSGIENEVTPPQTDEQQVTDSSSEQPQG